MQPLTAQRQQRPPVPVAAPAARSGLRLQRLSCQSCQMRRTRRTQQTMSWRQQSGWQLWAHATAAARQQAAGWQQSWQRRQRRLMASTGSHPRGQCRSVQQQ